MYIIIQKKKKKSFIKVIIINYIKITFKTRNYNIV